MNQRKKNSIKKVVLLACLLLLACGCYFYSLKFVYYKDMTQHKHALSGTTQSLLHQFDQPLNMTLYSKDADTFHAAQILIERYQLLQPNITFHWQREPLDFAGEGSHSLVLQYQTRVQKIDLHQSPLDESHLTLALFKLQRKANQWVVFLQGHGEPDLYGSHPHDFSLFRLALENQGLKIQNLNLNRTPIIPDNTLVLVIASPKTALLPKELKLILDYIKKGKDVLWLIDPTSTPIAELNTLLGVNVMPGTIIDLHGQKLGTPHPAITVIEQYPSLPFTPPNSLTAFPWAVALTQSKETDFKSQPLLSTNEFTWTETGPLSDTITFDPAMQEISGPLLLGLSLHRPHPVERNQEQRIGVIGNSRFLSNGTIENYGNLAFGLNLLNWLSHDDVLINISQPITQDTLLQIHLPAAITIQYGFPVLILILILATVLYFYRRRRRSTKISLLLSRS